MDDRDSWRGNDEHFLKFKVVDNRWVAKMIGTFLRATDTSSGQTERTGENLWSFESSKHQYGISTVVDHDQWKFHLDIMPRSVFLGVEKCTKADEGIYRYSSNQDQHSLNNFLHLLLFADVLSQTDSEGESTNLSFSYQVSLSWSLYNFPWISSYLFIFRIICQKGSLKKRGKVEYLFFLASLYIYSQPFFFAKEDFVFTCKGREGW